MTLDSRMKLSGKAEHSEMTLVLLGSYCCSKNLTGNTILGRKVFNRRRSEENVKEKGKVAGRKLTVVCTPGFEKDYLTEKKLEDAKLNILRGVTESSSGTHAFILVQSVHSSFAEEEKCALEKIMEPLGERVWEHTLVLFAAGDEQDDTPIELFIASEGVALQWLIEKCGNRYHVLHNKNWGDGSQVTELLEKIEEMVARNKGCPNEIDRETLQHVEEKRREQEKRTENRRRNQHLEYEMDKETSERVERTAPVSIKKQRSIDVPLNIAEGSTFSSGLASSSSAYGSMTIFFQETPGKYHFNKSVTSGLESLDSFPDSDGKLDLK